MTNKQLRHFVWLFLAMLGMAQSAVAADFKDFSVILNNQTGTLLTDEEMAVQGNAVNFGVAVAADGTVSRVAADDPSAIATISGKYHSEHGLTNMVATIPVDAPVKLTIGDCQYGSPATVKDANDETVFTFETANGTCYHSNTTANVKSGNYLGEPTTLTVSGEGYVPYLAVRKLTAEEIEALNSTFTLTYYDTDGTTVIGTQAVQGQTAITAFEYGVDDVTVADGKVFRGWFVSAEGGKKYQTTNKVESNLALYAVATNKEVADHTSTYIYDLTSETFYVEDHECIEMTGHYHNNHGWTFANGQTIKLAVGGDATITIGLCAYSGGNDVTVTDANEKTVTTFNDKGESDNQAKSFEYTGKATTLTLTFANGVYIHNVTIANHSKEDQATDVTATWDYANKGVMEETLVLSGSSTAGTVKAVEDNGILMTVEANGAAFRDNGNNIQIRNGAVFKVPVKNTGDLVVIKGYPGYSYYKINDGEEIQNSSANPQTEYKAKLSDVEAGYVTITSTNNNNYYYSIMVTQYAKKELVTLNNEPVTATFPFDLGTENQKATFTGDYFLSSKVAHGSDLTLEGVDNKSNGQTWFNPTAKASSAAEGNAIRFLIQPKFGFSFTPKKVSLKTTRYGTDGGKLDIAWQNPDGTSKSLATEVQPARDNATPNVSELSYDITGAVVDEGACGLLINLYSLDSGKRIGFSDIVIEGTLNGTEKEIPMLASFTANGVEYAADETFEANGDQYSATIELSKADNMISASNPVSNVTPLSGEIGEITYSGDDTKCAVTIPVVLNEITINYVANFIQKPDFTLTYFDTDGTEMGTQLVEKDAKIGKFDIDYTTAKAAEGEKVRGWFKTSVYGEKYTTEDVVTSNLKLYAVATEIEGPSNSKKYTFDLTQKTFYPEDHEAFTPSGEGYYWHDAQHGWAFKNGNTIDLLVGAKATISIGLCRYGYATAIVVKDANGNELGTLDGMSQTETDGEIVAFNYEGEAGKVTLELQATGEMYLHNVKIVNTSEVNFESNGQWYFVKAGDASSFIDVLDVVNGVNAQKDGARSYIYLPNGTYDLKQTVLTPISGHNISFIGESQNGVIIKNAPHYTTEGIGTTATLMNTGTGNYFQDLTIQNALDYYAAQAAGLGGGRAVALWDKGINTICKNVTLLSYQDTYYTNNPDGKYYWETSDIHGTVDFICGEGTLFVEKSTLTVEKRNADGSGGCTLTAPSSKAGNRYGYVFNNCKIENYAANYNLGRAWSNEPRCAYLNTTVNDNKMVASRWTAGGMNVAAKEFVEYNTMDINSNVVSPASNVIDFNKGDAHNKMETILTAEQAAEFTIEKVFTDWKPAEATIQLDAPKGATLKDGSITWSAVDGAIAYAIYADGELLAIVDADTTSYVIESEAEGETPVYTIRVANGMGGLGVAGAVDTTGTGIEKVSVEEDANQVIYDLQGHRVEKAAKGVYIINGKKVVVK